MRPSVLAHRVVLAQGRGVSQKPSSMEKDIIWVAHLSCHCGTTGRSRRNSRWWGSGIPAALATPSPSNQWKKMDENIYHDRWFVCLDTFVANRVSSGAKKTRSLIRMLRLRAIFIERLFVSFGRKLAGTVHKTCCGAPSNQYRISLHTGPEL